MIQFLSKLLRNAKALPDKIAIVDNPEAEGVTYAQLDFYSARVLSYLKHAGIGPEDFVAICLPRGAKCVVSALGVLKAGAAFVLLEESYTPERSAYIKSDCGCKAVIDFEVWRQIQHDEPSYEFADPGDHAAAFAVYTSGSTGNPKGVVHEYGNIQRIIDSARLEGEPVLREQDSVALFSPLTFVASLMSLFQGLYHGCTLHIVPYAVVKNMAAMQAYLYDHRITLTFLTPTYFRYYQKISPFLRYIIVGSEPANRIYSEDVPILNVYAMSESGFIVSVFQIDRLYDVTPIGKPPLPEGLMLLGDDGQPVPDGESGELCFYNPYVRGYLHLPEAGKNAFTPDRVFHSGDIAKRLEDGNYALLGRSNDMIKINGNRIEPAEIESAVKKVLGIGWAAAKGFEKDGSAFICAYYTEDIQVDYDHTREELQKYLPYYMLPSYFIKLDQIPLNANGKLDKKALKPPVADSYRADYAAPETEIEKKLCDAFASALHMERIGVNDDFYLLGGDSLRAIAVLAECDIEGMTIGEIFRGKTPAKIAALYRELQAGRSMDADEASLLSAPRLLSPEQLFMFDYQLYTPRSTMYNLFAFLRLGASVDLERFARAVRAAIQNHPALLTAFHFDDDGQIVQQYDPGLAAGLPVERISEQELAILRDELVQPFRLVGSPLYRCRVFQTESAGYFFFDVHHTVFDGTSSHVLFGDIEAAYSGQALRRDPYYRILLEQEKAAGDPFYRESKAYFEHLYDNPDFPTLPRHDYETRENRSSQFEELLPVSEEQLRAVAERHKVGYNVLFLAAASMMLSAYNKQRAAAFTWVYNGRDTADKMAVVGLLIRILPVRVSLEEDRPVRDLLSDLNGQVLHGIEHSVYPYVAKNLSCVVDDQVCLLYQDALRSFDTLCGEKMEQIDIRQNFGASQNAIDIEILRREEGFTAMFDAAAALYSEDSIRSMMKIFRDITARLARGVDEGTTVGDIVNGK